MTRAKDDLHLLVPQRFFVHGQASKGDRPLYASRTRFITEALLPNFEKITWPVVSATRSSTSGQAAQWTSRRICGKPGASRQWEASKFV
jgi:DNA helicase II / ATP-dependent DNA helicase PcrA